MKEISDTDLGVLVLRAPEERIERTDLDADTAVHAQREIDIEAIEFVLLARLATFAPRRSEVLMCLDEDAPIGTFAHA